MRGGEALPFRRLQSRWLAIFCCWFLVAGACGAEVGPKVEHDIVIPNDRTPWVIDVTDGQPQLVALHHSTIELNRHTGANLAGSLAGSLFYRPKLTTELNGEHARTQIHTSKPVFYLMVQSDPDAEDTDPVSFAIVQAAAVKDKRVVNRMSYSQFTGRAKRDDGVIETTVTQMPGGWLRIAPVSAMAEGEYCLLPLPKANGAFAMQVFDFGINASAPSGKPESQSAVKPQGSK